MGPRSLSFFSPSRRGRRTRSPCCHQAASSPEISEDGCPDRYSNHPLGSDVRSGFSAEVSSRMEELRGERCLLQFALTQESPTLIPLISSLPQGWWPRTEPDSSLLCYQYSPPSRQESVSIESPARMITPSSTRHNITRRPQSSFRSPG